MTTIANTNTDQAKKRDSAGGMVSLVVISASTVVLAYLLCALLWLMLAPLFELVPAAISVISATATA